MDTTKLNNIVTNINKLDLKSIWNSSSSDSQNQSLNDLVIILNSAIMNLNALNTALTKKEEYISICNNLSSLYLSKQKYLTEQEDSTISLNNIYQSISTLEQKRSTLRSEIIQILNDITGTSSEISQMTNLDVSTSTNILSGLNKDELIYELYEIYKYGGKGINKIAGDTGTKGLFSKYIQKDSNGNIIQSGEDYINEQIASVVSECETNREKAVNVALLILKLCSDKEVKLGYEQKGASGGVNEGIERLEGTKYKYKEGNKAGYNSDIIYDTRYNNITQMEDGMDCSAWVSYLLNVAVNEDSTVPNPEGFHWSGAPSMTRFGEQVSITDAQPGDIYISTGHTGMILKIEENPNDPTTGVIYAADSGGQYSWLSLCKFPYTENEDGTIYMNHSKNKIMNLDMIYSKEQQYLEPNKITYNN